MRHCPEVWPKGCSTPAAAGCEASPATDHETEAQREEGPAKTAQWGSFGVSTGTWTPRPVLQQQLHIVRVLAGSLSALHLETWATCGPDSFVFGEAQPNSRGHEL